VAYHLVGVDLGGTKIATALTDTDSKILKYETVDLPHESDADAILTLMLASIRRITADVRPESLLGVGVAMAGLVDPDAGVVVFSPNMKLHDVPIRERLSKELKWPIYVAHDIAMAALCEVFYGAARGRRDVLAVWVGTGIGAGMVLNGTLYQGSRGFAGELGQNTVRWDGPPCPGGNQGCLEHYASGPAMRRQAAEAIAAGRKTMLTGDAESLTVEQLSSAAQLGDELALEVIDRTAEVLGAGLTNAINMLNPEVLVLGGGVIRGVPMLVEKVGEVIARRAMPSWQRTDIVQAQYGREAAVIGATVFAKMAGRPEMASPAKG
jgi:glucokinase-like ROK family protein